MRITCRPSDRDYWRNHFKACPRILLDGKPLVHVAVADDSAGEVVIELHEPDGRLKLNAAGTGIARATLRGSVEIVGPRLGEVMQ